MNYEPEDEARWMVCRIVDWNSAKQEPARARMSSRPTSSALTSARSPTPSMSAIGIVSPMISRRRAADPVTLCGAQMLWGCFNLSRRAPRRTTVDKQTPAALLEWH